MELEAARPRAVAGFRLLRLVGRGGEGEVWEARDGRGQTCALKLIRPDCLAPPDAVAERGAWLEQIDHPALVAVRDSGVLDEPPLAGWGFVEMEYVDGDALAEAPAGWGWLDRLDPLAEALDLLHAGWWSDGVPLVHRDVKPANVVEAHDGRLVLVDPSTLRGVDSTVVTRVGTPVFAAPEVVTGRIGPPADVYSFAVTCVALLTGARGAELAGLLDTPDELDVPEGIRLGLSPAPADRPVSCRAMLHEDQPALVRDVPGADEWGATWILDTESAPATGPVPWSWFFLLAALAATPLVAALTGTLQRTELALVGAVVGLVHLTVFALARRSLGLAVLAPPVAWAFLLADRTLLAGSAVSGRLRRRRAWLRAVLTGALLPLLVPLALLADATPALEGAGVPQPGPGVVAGSVVGALALTSVGLVGAWLRGLPGFGVRAALLVPWAAGAGALVLGAGLLLPLAILVGRAAAASGLIVATVAGVAEALRGPPAHHFRHDA